MPNKVASECILKRGCLGVFLVSISGTKKIPLKRDFLKSKQHIAAKSRSSVLSESCAAMFIWLENGVKTGEITLREKLGVQTS